MSEDAEDSENSIVFVQTRSSPSKALADRGNIKKNVQNLLKSSAVAATNFEELEQGRGDGVGSSDASAAMNPDKNGSHDELEKLPEPFIKAILTRTHHCNMELDKLVESIDHYLQKNYAEGETVLFNITGHSYRDATILQKSGDISPTYTIDMDGTKMAMIFPDSLKRPSDITKEAIKAVIQSSATRAPGKPWEVNDAMRGKFDIKNKLASIFCTKKPTINNGSSQSNESSSDDDIPLANLQRRSAAGMPPGASRKSLESKEMKEKKNKEVKEKKEKEKLEKKEQKEREKKEKQEKKEQEKREKEALKPKKEKKTAADSMMKFMSSTSTPNSSLLASPNGGAPMTPSWSEKRLTSFVDKLNVAWRKRNLTDFNEVVARASKSLSGAQILRIDHEVHRFAVKKMYDANKDKDMLKKLKTKEQRKEFKDRMREERKAHYKLMEHKLTAYFNEKAIMDDLTVEDINRLPLYGEVMCKDRGMEAFSDCLMITQFVHSARKFLSTKLHVSAGALRGALSSGRQGFMEVTSNVLTALVSAIVQDPLYRKFTYANARLFELPVLPTTISEVCRAVLVGNTDLHGHDVQDADGAKKAEGDSQPSTEAETEAGSQEEEEDELDMSQIDVASCKSLLDILTPDKEVWQMTEDQQLELLRLMFNKVLELKTYREFISDDNASDAIKTLKAQVDKEHAKLEQLQADFAALEDLGDPDEDGISRVESRRRADNAKKRETLERKIEEQHDSCEDLDEKLQMERNVAKLTLRIQRIGSDRHMRNYFLLNCKSSDAGIWIQDFGTTAYEAMVKRCLAKGEPLTYVDETPKSAEVKTDENVGDAGGEKATTTTEDRPIASKKERSESPDLGPGGLWGLVDRLKTEEILPESEECSWSRIGDADTLKKLTDSLNTIGHRESELKTYLTKNRDVILSTFEVAAALQAKGSGKSSSNGSKDGSRDVSAEPASEKNAVDDEDEPDLTKMSPVEALRQRVVQLTNDLQQNFLTTLDDVDVFNVRLVECETLEQIKPCIAELAKSIVPQAVITQFSMKEALVTKCFSWFQLPRWLDRLNEAMNSSAVFLLTERLDSRVNWKKSLVEKRCTKCGRRGAPDTKISCAECDLVVHYSCMRLKEKPLSWHCVNCARQAEKKRKAAEEAEAKKRVIDYREDGSGSEVDSDENEDEEEDDEGDFFSKKRSANTSRANSTKQSTSRKRVLRYSDVEEDSDEDEIVGGRALRNRHKIPKRNPVTEECKELMDKVKNKYNRLYRSLLLVQVGRSTRKGATASTLEEIEGKIDEYNSVAAFADELYKFLERAIGYFQEHNERKVPEVEELMFALDLKSYV